MDITPWLFLLGLAVLSAAFTAGAGAVLRPWLAAPTRDNAWRPITSVLLLGVICWLTFVYGGSYPMVIIPMLIWVSATIAAVASVWRWRHVDRLRAIVAGALMGIGFPALLLWIPEANRAELHSRYDACAAPLVVDALDRYRAVAGRYPSAFRDLYFAYPRVGPTFAPLEDGNPPFEICRATNVTHWLYETTGNQYVLGYWQRYPGIEALGARVCLYRSDARVWRCEWNGWGPFPPVARAAGSFTR